MSFIDSVDFKLAFIPKKERPIDSILFLVADAPLGHTPTISTPASANPSAIPYPKLLGREQPMIIATFLSKLNFYKIIFLPLK